MISKSNCIQILSIINNIVAYTFLILQHSLYEKLSLEILVRIIDCFPFGVSVLLELFITQVSQINNCKER